MLRYILFGVFFGIVSVACEPEKKSSQEEAAATGTEDAAKKSDPVDAVPSMALFQLLNELKSVPPEQRAAILEKIRKLDLSYLASIAKDSPLKEFFTEDGGKKLAEHLKKIDPAQFQGTLGDLVDQAREILKKVADVVTDILDGKVIFGDCGRLVMENDGNECAMLRKLGDDMKQACIDAGGTSKKTECDLNNQPMPTGCNGREFTTCQGANGPEQMRMAFVECIFTPPADPKEKRKDYCKGLNEKALDAKDANP